MAYFAEIEDGIVKRVNCIKHSGAKGQAFCDAKGGTWVETSKAREFRYNYAGRGYTYDKENDAFYAPQPYESWELDSDFQWQPPVPRPDDADKMYEWNEESGEWVEIVMEE